MASRGQFSADILANSSERFTVALGKSYQDTDPAYLIGLPRTRRYRPRCRHACHRFDEIAPSHCVPQDSGTHAEYLGALGAIAAWFFRKWNWASFRPVGSGQH